MIRRLEGRWRGWRACSSARWAVVGGVGNAARGQRQSGRLCPTGPAAGAALRFCGQLGRRPPLARCLRPARDPPADQGRQGPWVRAEPSPHQVSPAMLAQIGRTASKRLVRHRMVECSAAAAARRPGPPSHPAAALPSTRRPLPAPGRCASRISLGSSRQRPRRPHRVRPQGARGRRRAGVPPLALAA